MSVFDDPLVDDVRALLSAFARNDMRSMTVEVRPGVQLLISRDAPESHGSAIVAPHVGTLAHRLPDGEAVHAGETVATLDLLGEDILVKAEATGIVSASSAAVGALVEFGEPLAWIEDVES